jgi:hypothetical protein
MLFEQLWALPNRVIEARVQPKRGFKMLMNTGFRYRSAVSLVNVPLPYGRGSDSLFL